jgi:sugar O-acyltransferase (sialic acid O-acetyltransferase NeuD family)
LIGCGSQGRITLEILEDNGNRVFGFLDDKEFEKINISLRKKVIGNIDKAKLLSRKNHKLIICIGNNYIREEIFKRLNVSIENYGNAIHRSSIILGSASIGFGNMIFAHTYIGSNSNVGNHTIINNGAIVEHDCKIADFVALGPGCCMAGRVNIGEGAFISAGVTIAPRINIGAKSIIGAGAVIVKDIPPGVLAYGNPAKIIRAVDSIEMWNRLL